MPARERRGEHAFGPGLRLPTQRAERRHHAADRRGAAVDQRARIAAIGQQLADEASFTGVGNAARLARSRRFQPRIGAGKAPAEVCAKSRLPVAVPPMPIGDEGTDHRQVEVVEPGLQHHALP